MAAMPISAHAQKLAFPGAQGWGRFATGARDKGTVYHVTNLNDSGAGSLRDAVSQPNRIVVFDVSGVINITNRIVFASNLYVAGQTAPGEGIIVYGNGVSFSGADNIIVRYMRFRQGKKGKSGTDAGGIAHGKNMIFDHCSFSWGLDETFSINWDSKGTAPRNITISNCIMGQGLSPHSAGGLIQADSVSLYRNLYCDNNTRNNKVKGISQYVNNIVYNWHDGCYIMGGDSEGSSAVNITNNLFVNGPETGNAGVFSRANSDFHAYVADNLQDGNFDGVYNPSEITNYNEATIETAPYKYPILATWRANQLVDSLLPQVGANLPYRDFADAYMVHEVKSFGQSGVIISNENQLPIGVPSSWKCAAFEKPTDSDNDGMPDEWEKANGTNPNADDAMTIAANGYANIENYVNGISKSNVRAFLRAPQLVASAESKQNSIKLSWYDFTEGHDGFVIERKDGDAYKEIGRVKAGEESFVADGLAEGTSYSFRVAAYKGDALSEYAELNAKTLPKYVPMVDCNHYEANAYSLGKEANGSNVLLSPSMNLSFAPSDTITPNAIVVAGSKNTTITRKGNGTIAGSTSVNKIGKGSLSLNGDFDYTGATVLHEGTVKFNTVADGGKPSSLGASIEYPQNWVWDGGTWEYTGSDISTNRCAQIYNDTELKIDSATLQMTGKIVGSGNVSLSGNGTLHLPSNKFFGFSGDIVLKGGKLIVDFEKDEKNETYLSDKEEGFSKLVLAGGSFEANAAKESGISYNFPIEALENTYSTFSVARNCSIKNNVTGRGTIEYRIPYVREYISGNWNEFYGTLVAKGVGKEKDGCQLMFSAGGINIPNAVIHLSGNTRVVSWKAGSISLGGLSGEKGTFLSSNGKKSSSATMTWRVGGANTDETFNGVIDNRCSANGHNAKTSIIKEGSGYWRLTGNNIHSGVTSVYGGNLIIDGSFDNTSSVSVVAGRLSGVGKINAPVSVFSEGEICAGDTMIDGSILLLKKTLNVSGGKIVVPLSGDKVNTLQIDGDALTINDATLQIGDEEDGNLNLAEGTALQVFTATAIPSGNGFSHIYPETPGAGLHWDTAELMTKGIIRVASTSGIHGVEASSADASSPKYSLNGMRLDKARGIYIQNGKKYIAR